MGSLQGVPQQKPHHCCGGGLTTGEETGNKNVRYRTNLTCGEVLHTGRFLLTPRGDNKFSFRFAEVLAASGIPVYHTDNYLFPFRPEMIGCGKLCPEHRVPL